MCQVFNKIMLVVLCCMIYAGTSWAVNISGTVYLSSLEDNASVDLTGNTTLIVDVDKTLKYIGGDYALTIQGQDTSKKLTVKKGGRTIYVASLNIKTARVEALGGNNTAIYAHSGSVSIQQSVVIVTAVSGIWAKENLDITSSTLDIEAGLIALKAETGYIQIDGILNITSNDSDGINADKDVIINHGNANINVGGDAIYSRHGNIKINGTSVNLIAYGYRGFYAPDGDIYLNGTIKTCSGNNTAISTDAGKITIDGNVIVTNGASGIFAYKDLVINKSASVSSGLVALKSTTGSIYINGNAVATSRDNDAVWAYQNITINPGADGFVIAHGPSGKSGIRASNGNVSIVSGRIQAEASNGIYAGNSISILGGDITASGSNRALYADNGLLSISSPLKIISPENGANNGHTIIDKNGRTAEYAVISTPPLSGTVNLDTPTPHPGSWVRYRLSGDVLQLYQNGVELTTQWQLSYNGETNWVDVNGSTDSNGRPVYIVTTDDLDKYLRVKLTAYGYKGTLYSSAHKISKSQCTIDVVAPELQISNNQVRVTNPQTTQEYIIFNTKREISGLTESDWANAKTFNPGDAFLFMGGTTNANNYVYTRVKETDYSYAGTDVRMACIYLGTTTYTQSFDLTVKGAYVRGSTTYTYDLEQESNYYYTSVGSVVQLTATPIPANATNFNGIYYNNWINNSNDGTFYADVNCTRTLTSGQYYTTVYFKPSSPTYSADIAAEYTKGYNDVVHVGLYLHIADANGNQPIQSMSATVTIGKGETQDSIPVSTNPSKGTLHDMTATLYSGTGNPPVISFNVANKTISVNAENATKGSYFFNVSQDGISVIGGIRVNVTAPDLEDIVLMPNEAILDPGSTLQLTPLLLPYGAEEDITWSSSNLSVATVNSSGMVTVPDNADVGATATITATANGKTSTCTITISGEKFDLWVAGTQVTTHNMDHLAEIVAGLSDQAMQQYLTGEMDVTFDGNTLTLKNAVIHTGNQSAQGLTLGVQGMRVKLIGENSITSVNYSALKVQKSAKIYGNGTLNLSGHDCGILFEASGMTSGTITLELNDSAHVVATGAKGVGSLDNDINYYLAINGTETRLLAAGSQYSLGGLRGLILNNRQQLTAPEGTQFMNGYVVDASNNRVQGDTVVIEVPLTDYNLYVKGIHVTSRNMDYLGKLIALGNEIMTQKYYMGDMNVWYDPDDNSLHLLNAEIVNTSTSSNDNESTGIINRINSLTVNVEGECSVSSQRYGMKLGNATIIGNGSLDVNASSAAVLVLSNETLTIKDGIKLTAQGSFGIFGMNVNTSHLNILGKETVVRAKGSSYSLGHFGDITLDNYLTVIEPACAAIVNGNAVDIDGNAIRGEWVTISKPIPYAVLSQDGKTLTFYCDGMYNMNLHPGTQYDLNEEANKPDWYNDNSCRNISAVIFDSSFTKALPSSTAWWFASMSNLTSITGFEYLNTIDVMDMRNMFSTCWSLDAIDVSHFNTGKVENMSYMFNYCEGLTSLDLSSFDTQNVRSMEGMFFECSGLTNLNLSSFNTENVKIFKEMFLDCAGLTRLDLSHFDTGNAESFSGMFMDCSGLTDLNLSGFNTETVDNMSGMFSYCSNLTTLDLSGFNTSYLLQVQWMFSHCRALRTIYVSNDWNTFSVDNADGMFYNCTSLVGGKGTTYDPYHIDNEYAHLDGGESDPGYFTEKYLRGDVNGDSSVNIADVSALIDLLLDGDTLSNMAADADLSGSVAIGDVSALIDYLLSGTW